MLRKSKNKLVDLSLNKLATSLLFLMKDHAYKDISITNICNQSNVTRITFYRNCDSKDDIVEFICNKHINSFIESLDFENETVKEIIYRFFKYNFDNKELLLNLYHNNLFIIFEKSLISLSMQRIDSSFNYKLKNDEIITKRYIQSFIVGGLSLTLRTWITHDFNIEIDKLVDICLKYIFNDTFVTLL